MFINLTKVPQTRKTIDVLNQLSGRLGYSYIRNGFLGLSFWGNVTACGVVGEMGSTASPLFPLSASCRPGSRRCAHSLPFSSGWSCLPVLALSTISVSRRGIQLKLFSTSSAYYHKQPRTLVPPLCKLCFSDDDQRNLCHWSTGIHFCMARQSASK